jgi:hypothetical protein
MLTEQAIYDSVDALSCAGNVDNWTNISLTIVSWIAARLIRSRENQLISSSRRRKRRQRNYTPKVKTTRKYCACVSHSRRTLTRSDTSNSLACLRNVPNSTRNFRSITMPADFFLTPRIRIQIGLRFRNAGFLSWSNVSAPCSTIVPRKSGHVSRYDGLRSRRASTPSSARDVRGKRSEGRDARANDGTARRP